MADELTIRPAQPDDIPLILAFIRELADYERCPDCVCATEADLLRHGFGAEPRFRCLIAEAGGEPAGFVLYFYNYSTWEGRAGIYIEDFYVRPQFRKQGVGRSLFRKIAGVARDERLGRISWQVLDWNQTAIDFYTRLGATPASEWRTMRLDQAAIEKLST